MIKSTQTPKSQIKSALRQLWLRSRERGMAVKRDGNTCTKCGAKNSRAKGREVYVEVHHKFGIQNWNEIYAAIYKNLLIHPDELVCLCKECHGEQEHEEDEPQYNGCLDRGD